MRSSFSFPPPPPPPPKASAPDRTPENAPYQRGGYDSSHGGRGGRGYRGSRGRGRGNNHRGSQRDGYRSEQPHISNAENFRSNGGGNINMQAQMRGQSQFQQYSQGYSAPNSYPPSSTQCNQPTVTLASYLNPNFLPLNTTSPLQWNLPAQASVSPAAYAQTLSSLMASHAGAQSTNIPTTNILYNNPSPDNQTSGTYVSSTSSPSVKRKRGSSNPYQGSHASPNSARTSQQQRPPKAKVDVAPAVPSFGFALPTVSQQPPSVDAFDNSSKKKKRKFNQLGLTPKSEEHEDSDDGDVDEEAAFQKASEGSVYAALFCFILLTR